MKKAQLWLGYDQYSDLDERIRIIYPNGKCGWRTVTDFKTPGTLFGTCWANVEHNNFDMFCRNMDATQHLMTPCWAIYGASMKQQIKAMKAYDKSSGRKTMFLGYV